MTRGEVWWVDFPGRVGRRPAVVLTRDPVADRIRAPVVALCTTTVRGLRSEVPLGPDEGMPRSCVANFDNLHTVERTLFDSLICTLPPATLVQVGLAIRYALSC